MLTILSIIGLLLIIIAVIVLEKNGFIRFKPEETKDKVTFSKKDKDVIDLISQLADLRNKLEQ